VSDAGVHPVTNTMGFAARSSKVGKGGVSTSWDQDPALPAEPIPENGW
jgi:hypothetical protein